LVHHKNYANLSSTRFSQSPPPSLQMK